LPPDNQDVYKSDAVEVAIDDPRDTFRTALIISSSPFSSGNWTSMQPGQLILVKRGAITWNSALLPEVSASRVLPSFQPQAQQQSAAANPMRNEQARTQQSAQSANQSTLETPPRVLVTSVRSITQTPEGKSLSYRTFEVTHATNYKYSEPVEHSTHVFRLQPTEDPIQQIIFSSLAISSPGEEIQFEDVFGNQSVHCTIDQPYQALSVTAKSRVQIFEAPPDNHSLSRRQTTIPLVWMPWQRQMMMPYLLPPELPEPQLRELTEYAMSFVERNDYHLVRTIKDINLSIYQDYKYVPGSTSLATTPFEVYATRQGVCQDFANLFICLTRLLSIPARYRMGYIYTGGNYENKIQSDASHAWAEVYLPYVGWRGFDPTNGCAVAQDHIRIACGRNYIDATPTSGTIYKGGGTETLTVEVKVKELTE
jgi:transglutaminase-like putative cysteine protease